MTSYFKNDLSKIFKKTCSTIPIWLMRQAGRYLPEYNDIRKNNKNFLDLCYNSKLVTEITLQPIKRFNIDAAIIFSDILVLPHSLGWDITFKKNYGPILDKFRSIKDLSKLKNNFNTQIENIYESIILTKQKLPKKIPLIGFSGSPWTVISYMIEGGKNSNNFLESKKLLYNEQKLIKTLINFITDKTIEHLSNQIKAGVDIIQLFDSWAGILSNYDYNDLVIKPTTMIVESIRKNFPHIPIIGFPKGSGFLYTKYIKETKIDIISVDQYIPINIMKEWQSNIIIQGNLDPIILLCDKKIISKAINNILSQININKFIFNLGHGILPNTDPNNVEFLVNYIKSYNEK